MRGLIPDTSVVVAAMLASHVHHTIAATVCAELDDLVEHSAIEVYSVLTRLPAPNRLDPEVAAATVAAHFRGRRLRLPAAEAAGLLGRLAAAGVAGGAVYDGAILAAADHHERTVLTLDRRMLATARRLDATAELIL